jgi:hypothetical protein
MGVPEMGVVMASPMRTKESSVMTVTKRRGMAAIATASSAAAATA